MRHRRGAPSVYAHGRTELVDATVKNGRVHELIELMAAHGMSVQGVADYLGGVTGDALSRMTVQKWLMDPDNGGTKEVPGWALVLLRQKGRSKPGKRVSKQ